MRIPYLQRALCLICLFPVLFLSSSVRHAAGETFAFQADNQKLMKIIINSLYKSKEIFLRELISNASDALEKIRLLSLKNPNVLGTDSHLNITVRYNKTDKVLIIADSGIGMTKDDLIKNLGTIAKSGTADYLSQLEKANDTSSSLIGQFGVGFYSSFLVANSVTVLSQHPDSDGTYSWSSTSHSDFVVSKVDQSIGRGTQIHLHMKDEDVSEFLDDHTLRSLIEKYSQFANFDIFLYAQKTIEVDAEPEPNAETEKTDETASDEKKKETDETDEKKETDEDNKKKETDEADEKKEEQDDDDDVTIESEPKKKEEEKPKKVQKTIYEWEKVNVNKPIWLREPKDVQTEEYNAFYKAYFKDYRDPLAHVFFKGEGETNFRLLFYFPQKPETDVFQVTPDHYAHNFKLFVRRVFITDELLGFLPKFLNFLKGLVDSDDFPLNVSRETIQNSPVLDRIKRTIVSKAIAKIKELTNNETEYLDFYKNFGVNLKLGLLEDKRHQSTIASLLRFQSTLSETNLTSLDAYIERMRKGQKNIYFITASSVEHAKKSPYLEALEKRGYEVLFLIDGIDEYLSQSLPSYGGFMLQNVGKGDIEFGDEDEDTKKSFVELEKKFQPLAKFLEEKFSKDVGKVRISNRLTKSSCALVAPESGWTGRMHHVMMAQKDLSNPMFHYYANQKKVFEINPHHPIIQKLLTLVTENKMTKDSDSLVKSLFDMAWIKGEFPIHDVNSITKRIETVIRLGLEIDLNKEAEVHLKPAPEMKKDAKEEATSDSKAEGEKKAEEEASEEKVEETKKEEAEKASKEEAEGAEKETAEENKATNADDMHDEL